MYYKIFTEKVCLFLFVLILSIYPLTNIIHYYYPINIFDKNLYSLICFLISYLIIFLILTIKFKENILLVIFIAIFILLLSINLLVHANNNKIHYVVQYEVGFSLFVFSIIAYTLINKENLNLISNIVIASCLIQSISSLFNAYFTYGEITTFFNFQSNYRQSGFLLNANLFSSFLSTGFILNLHRKYTFFDNYFLNLILKISFLAIFALSIYLTESRLHIYFLAFYFFSFIAYRLINFMKIKLKFGLIFLSLPIILMTLFFLIVNDLSDLNHRVSIGLSDNIRIVKYYLGIKTILVDILSLFIGMDRELFTSFRILNLRLSDNSIIYLIMYFGIPYACLLLISSSYYLIKSSKINILSIFFLGSFFLNLILTGAIFWHVYLLYFCTVYILIFKIIFQNK